MLANAETLFRKGLGLSWLVRPGEQQMNKTGRTARHQHTSTDSAISLEPPPINECNTTALTSTLDVVHEVLAVIPVGTVGRLFVFKTDAGGCGSVWTASHNEGGTHLVNDVSIVDQSELTTEHGLDGTDKTKGVNGWESTFMLGYVPGVHYHAQVTVDGSTTAQVDVTA